MEKLTEGIRLITTNLFMDVLFLYYLGIKKKKSPTSLVIFITVF